MRFFLKINAYINGLFILSSIIKTNFLNNEAFHNIQILLSISYLNILFKTIFDTILLKNLIPFPAPHN